MSCWQDEAGDNDIFSWFYEFGRCQYQCNRLPANVIRRNDIVSIGTLTLHSYCKIVTRWDGPDGIGLKPNPLDLSVL